MDSLDKWRLCDELTIKQAALLIAGEDPSSTQYYIENWEPHKRPAGYEAAKAALTHAILSGQLWVSDCCREESKFIETTSTPFEESDAAEFIPNAIDLDAITIFVTSLKKWLKIRGIEKGFFFPASEMTPDYLDKNYNCYSPKLAAAIHAWLALVENQSLRKGTSVKQALMKWLRLNANKYGLTNLDGNPNETAIEEIAKIANWDMKGGAPKTPDKSNAIMK